jgi:hypothetical protein
MIFQLLGGVPNLNLVSCMDDTYSFFEDKDIGPNVFFFIDLCYIYFKKISMYTYIHYLEKCFSQLGKKARVQSRRM